LGFKTTIVGAGSFHLTEGEGNKMNGIQTLRSWIGALTNLFIGLIGLGIVASVAVGPENMGFVGNVVSNLTGLISDLGSSGLAGLITLGIIIWLLGRDVSS
jgi:hypothetical protein